MLERLLPFWRGKLFVLVLLGFAATDFIITITLSAADATAHLVENPLRARRSCTVSSWWITLVLIALLGAVFLKGFTRGHRRRRRPRGGLPRAQRGGDRGRSRAHRSSTRTWSATGPTALTAEHGNPLMMIALALLVFPKLALGLSGFETGVAVMPPRRRATPRHRGASGGPDPQHQEAAHRPPRAS